MTGLILYALASKVQNIQTSTATHQSLSNFHNALVCCKPANQTALKCTTSFSSSWGGTCQNRALCDTFLVIRQGMRFSKTTGYKLALHSCGR